MRTDFQLYQLCGASGRSPAARQKNVLFFKFHYTPPYEKFEQLKEFQLEERANNPFGYRLLIEADLTEWVGHEEEEYFVILCKYLADMRERWDYTFTTECENTVAVKRLYIRLRMYMQGTFHPLERPGFHGIAADIENLGLYTSEATQALTEIFSEKPLRDQYSSDLLFTVTGELLNMEVSSAISPKTIRKYAEDPDSLIFLLSDGRCAAIRRDEDEKL